MNKKERAAEIKRLREIGKKGGLATKKAMPADHFKKAGSKGGKSKWGIK